MKMKIMLAAIISVLLSLPVMAQVGKKSEEKPTPKSTPAKKTTSAPARRSTPAPRTSRTNKDRDEAAANERTFWESIRNSTNPEDFRSYLNKYPNGEFADLARNKISTLEAAVKERQKEEERKEEATYWDVIKNSSNPEDFRAYLRKYPNGRFVALANNRIASLTEVPAGRPGATTKSQETRRRSTEQPASNNAEQSSATLEETMNWIGTKLIDSAFTQIIITGGTWVHNVGSTLVLSSFQVDRCALTLNYTNGDRMKKNKFIIPFSDLDPLSIKTPETSSGKSLEVQATNPTLRVIEANEEMTKASVDFLFYNAENRVRFEKALRHAIRLCGGKGSPF